MPIFNDLNLDNWKESEILTDSLWIIPERDKTGKHNGFYHGNFIPQIPHQLILRYTKKNEIVFDPFLGSGTTVYEAESLSRNFIGLDIQIGARALTCLSNSASILRSWSMITISMFFFLAKAL